MAAGLLAACGGGSPAAPIDGATVTIGGKSYTIAGGRITLQARLPLRSEVDIVSGGMLERRTLVRDAAMTSFALWPSRSATGIIPRCGA